MILSNIHDVDRFFEVVESCEGNVYLISKEGDKLNLKSQLCKYIAFSEIFTGDNAIEMEIKTDNSEDLNKFINFAMRG